MLVSLDMMKVKGEITRAGIDKNRCMCGGYIIEHIIPLRGTQLPVNLIRLRFDNDKTLLISKMSQLLLAHATMSLVHNYVVFGGKKSNPATSSVQM